MSEFYEGIVVQGERTAVRRAFDTLRSPLTFRLVHLGSSVFGIYRVATRSDRFDMEALLTAAKHMAGQLDAALAVFYDNRVGVRTTALVDERGIREFGEADELWVPLDEDGEPMRDAQRLRSHELEPEGEYDCITSTLDMGLEQLGVRATVTPGMLKDALCYERLEWEAERLPTIGEE